MLVWEDLLEKGKATHSSVLAWRIPWGRKESDMTEQLSLSHVFIYLSLHWVLVAAHGLLSTCGIQALLP